MAKYSVKLSKTAVKYYEKLPPNIKNKVKEVINQLRENPYAIANVKPLEGSNHDDFRIRERRDGSCVCTLTDRLQKPVFYLVKNR